MHAIAEIIENLVHILAELRSAIALMIQEHRWEQSDGIHRSQIKAEFIFNALERRVRVDRRVIFASTDGFKHISDRGGFSVAPSNSILLLGCFSLY